jgi:hypothetical protein
MNVKSKMGVFLSLLLSGCSTMQPDKQTLNINCAADVILKVNGDRYPCPAKVDVRRDKTAIVEATQPGYDNYRKEIGCHLSFQAKADAVGTAFLFFPVFGLLSAGAWDLDETEINVVLHKLN